MLQAIIGQYNKWWGVLYITGVLICNEFFVKAFVSPDGHLEISTRLLLFLLNISWILWGIVLFLARKEKSQDFCSESRLAMFQRMIPGLFVFNLIVTTIILYVRWYPRFYEKEEMIITILYFSSLWALFVLANKNVNFFPAGLIWNTVHALVVILVGFFILLSFLPWEQTRQVILRPDPKAGILYLPKPVLQDLKEIHAVIGNTTNPTGALRHDTILVKPDEEFGYVLRPGAAVNVWLLRSMKSFNLDPPTLYIKTDVVLTDRIREYVDQMARHSFCYHITQDGYRQTLPPVSAERSILIIGDSVGFGMGVNDEFTVASYLQKMVSERYGFVNASVGGYNGYRCVQVANRESQKRKYEALIYVACENDFVKDAIGTAQNVINQLASLSEIYNNKIIIVLHTYMEYTLRDLIFSSTSDKRNREISELRPFMKNMCEKLGFEYCDWSAIVERYSVESQSIFSRFALYVDHCHLSPLGNQLMAQDIYMKLSTLGLVDY
ncbi:MAG: SGNH/GDSL hydrolase family protein [Candidatus Omnitrophota bacterium]|jgi:hypothetical protein|nr:MAG: SGNH/GDSL hydrolase family protein [Candidatus Omnitrophota bacterium]